MRSCYRPMRVGFRTSVNCTPRQVRLPVEATLPSARARSCAWIQLLIVFSCSGDSAWLRQSFGTAAVSTSSPVSTTTGELRLWLTGSRSPLSTRLSCQPSMHYRRGPPHRSRKQGAPCSPVPRGAASSCSLSRSQNAGAHLRASSTAAWVKRWSGLLACFRGRKVPRSLAAVAAPPWHR